MSEMLNTEEAFVLEKKHNVILRMMCILTKKQKEVVYLLYIEGYNTEEISNILNITERNVNKRLKVSLTKLQKLTSCMI